MADYTRPTQRFIFTGISCLPSDVLPLGKMPYLKNMRAYVDASLKPRVGLTVKSNSLGAGIHSLARLNDPTTFNGGVPAIRVIGAGTAVFTGVASGTTFASLDTGYSGDPLVFCSAQPPQSPRPYQYVADANQFRKFTTDGNALNVGIAQPSDPSTEPSVALDVQHISSQDIQTSTAWLPAGTVASATGIGTRVSTVISQILYDDSVNNTGYASIVPADPANITTGTLLTVGNPVGSFENALVTDITIAIAPTTVEAIIYDSGTTGLCTIQPAGSLGTGQLEAPSVEVYKTRAIQPSLKGDPLRRFASEDFSLPPDVSPTDPRRTIRQVDFPVNSIIVLNGAETVRILSVAVGPDGVQSFRCSTSTTIAAGQTITGLAAFRIFLSSTWTAGAGLLRASVGNFLSYPEPLQDEKSRMTGGIQSVFAINLAQFSNGQAVLPEDELHLAVNINRLSEVVSVRVYIDVDQTTNDFLQNYFFHEWRASDIITAIQGTNAANVTPLVDARRTVVANLQLELKNQFSQMRRQVGKFARPGFDKVINQIDKKNPSLSAIATQLALGNNQWIDLRVKIGTLTRVGTDTTRTLANAAAFEILVACEAPSENLVPEPIHVEYSDLQIYGGGGIDVGDAGDPIVYSYRYRSSETGAKSNPSPPSRGGVIPRRQDALLTPTVSTDPQVDRIDWFRLGGALTQHTYVGTGPNSATAYRDRYMDSQIDGGEVLTYESFQPWPLQDLPRTGTCNVAGTAVEWVSGDTFDTAWAPGSFITINGRSTTLYASPSDSTHLFLVDSVGSGSAVEFSLQGPTLLSQPLARFWGTYQGLYFACGDQTNPGTLYWTNPNNIEEASDANSLVVTTPSEPLQNGGIYNTFPFVFSSEQFYALQYQPGATSPVRAIQTPCGRGVWTPWAFDIGPDGVYFLGPDGIYVTAGGSPARSLTDADLRAIFPKDGLPGVTTNNIPAVDMTQTTRLRIAYISGWVYFDYLDLTGTARTLIYDIPGQRWFLDDTSLTDIQVRLEEPGAGVYDQIIGGSNGFLYQYDEDAIRDDTADLAWAAWTRWIDGEMPRQVKQFGDLGVDLDAAGSVSGIVVAPVTDDGVTFPTGATIGIGDTTRQNYIVDLDSGDGVLSRNFGVRFSGTLGSTDTGRPSLFWWEPAYLVKAEDTARRATDWEDLGYQGAKFVQGVIIRANTYGVDKLVRVQKDGGTTALILTINHDGEEQIAYPLAAVGWDPFITELIRLEGADDNPWQLLSVRFVWEPAPELATQWETQFTSEDWPGYGTVRDMVFAYEATTPFILTFTYDDRTQVYVIPSSNGQYKRYYFPFCPNKALSNKFQWKTEEPGRIYKRDVSTRIQGWGQPGGYRVVNPFGGPSRVDGAAI